MPVIGDEMILLLRRPQQRLQVLFNEPDNPPKLPLLDPVQYNGSLILRKSPPNANRISIDSAVLAGLTNVTNRQTDTQTDHATPSVVIGRI